MHQTAGMRRRDSFPPFIQIETTMFPPARPIPYGFSPIPRLPPAHMMPGRMFYSPPLPYRMSPLPPMPFMPRGFGYLPSKPFKTILCRSYTKTGTCPMGDSCTYAHGEHELTNRHSKFRTEVCRNYLKGNCSYGVVCSFLHPTSPVSEDSGKGSSSGEDEEDMKKSVASNQNTEPCKMTMFSDRSDASRNDDDETSSQQKSPSELVSIQNDQASMNNDNLTVTSEYIQGVFSQKNKTASIEAELETEFIDDLTPSAYNVTQSNSPATSTSETSLSSDSDLGSSADDVLPISSHSSSIFSSSDFSDSLAFSSDDDSSTCALLRATIDSIVKAIDLDLASDIAHEDLTWSSDNESILSSNDDISSYDAFPSVFENIRAADSPLSESHGQPAQDNDDWTWPSFRGLELGNEEKSMMSSCDKDESVESAESKISWSNSQTWSSGSSCSECPWDISADCLNFCGTFLGLSQRPTPALDVSVDDIKELELLNTFDDQTASNRVEFDFLSLFQSFQSSEPEFFPLDMIGETLTLTKADLNASSNCHFNRAVGSERNIINALF